MNEREQNLFIIFFCLIVAGFCWLMKIATDYETEKILSVQPTCYYKKFNDGTILAGLHLPVNPNEYPDCYGPRLKDNFVCDTLEIFGIPLNEMWGVFEDYSRVKYREFESYSQMMEELRKVDFMILIYQSNN